MKPTVKPAVASDVPASLAHTSPQDPVADIDASGAADAEDALPELAPLADMAEGADEVTSLIDVLTPEEVKALATPTPLPMPAARQRGTLPRVDVELIPSDPPPVTPARSAARPSSAMRARAGSLSSGFDRPVIAPLPELMPEPVARPRLVGIGASAGGLEALRLLLPTLPVDRGLTYVVLQHLAPTHRSMLAEILSQRSLMPVRELRDGDTLTPNEIFICPPNAHVEFDGEALHLREPEPQALPLSTAA